MIGIALLWFVLVLSAFTLMGASWIEGGTGHDSLPWLVEDLPFKCRKWSEGLFYASLYSFADLSYLLAYVSASLSSAEVRTIISRVSFAQC